MSFIAAVAVLLVAALHGWFLVLEMVLWTRPLGRKTFGTTTEFAEQTRGLAANQGLYNGFLVAGLLWGVVSMLIGPTAAPSGYAIDVFFLSCVIVAGVFGAVTVNRRILYVQAAPAVVALLLVLLARPS